jgi:hypothetical protein
LESWIRLMPTTNRVICFGTFAVALMMAVGPVLAQPSTTSREAGMALELRLGSLWPQPPLILDRDDEHPSTSSFATGGRFGYNFAEPLGGRLGPQLIERLCGARVCGVGRESHSLELQDAAGSLVIRQKTSTTAVLIAIP